MKEVTPVAHTKSKQIKTEERKLAAANVENPPVIENQ